MSKGQILLDIRHPAEKELVPVVWDGAIATIGVAEGVMIPLVILDTSNRPDIEDMIAAHKHLGGQGDVKSIWAAPPGWAQDRIRLVLTMLRPSRCVFIMEFNLVKQGGLVDQIIRAELLYVQAGRPGDRIATNIDADRVIAEVPSADFRREWDELYRKALIKNFRQGGMKKRDAIAAVDHFLREWREIGSHRMPQQ